MNFPWNQTACYVIEGEFDYSVEWNPTRLLQLLRTCFTWPTFAETFSTLAASNEEKSSELGEYIENTDRKTQKRRESWKENWKISYEWLIVGEAAATARRGLDRSEYIEKYWNNWQTR